MCNRLHLMGAILLYLGSFWSSFSFADSSTAQSTTSQSTIRIIGARSDADVMQDYFVHLIEMALMHTEGPWSNAKIVSLPYSQKAHGGIPRMIIKGEIDLYWSATNHQKEHELLPVRIPLMKGLLGYRVAITHKDNLQIFRQSGGNLSQFTACQVQYWPDVQVLEHNKYAVFPVEYYEKAFELTQLKRCDYFPRAIYEGYRELEIAKQQYPDLVIYDEVILSYLFPLYLFTSKDRGMLNRQLEKGLRMLMKKGKFEELMQSHPATANVFPKEQWSDRKIVSLENPNLPDSAPIEESDLWLRLQ